jgi:dTDP-4-amino-4,6-dideoxygalactose transaminase
VRFDRGLTARRLRAAWKLEASPAGRTSPQFICSRTVDRFGYQPGDFPIAEDLGCRSLALPFERRDRGTKVETVCRALREAIGG